MARSYRISGSRIGSFGMGSSSKSCVKSVFSIMPMVVILAVLPLSQYPFLATLMSYVVEPKILDLSK